MGRLENELSQKRQDPVPHPLADHKGLGVCGGREQVTSSYSIHRHALGPIYLVRAGSSRKAWSLNPCDLLGAKKRRGASSTSQARSLTSCPCCPRFISRELPATFPRYEVMAIAEGSSVHPDRAVQFLGARSRYPRSLRSSGFFSVLDQAIRVPRGGEPLAALACG